MPPSFVDARELARRLGVSYATVLTWTRRGKLPHVRDSARRILYNLDAVLRELGPQPDHDASDKASGEGGDA